MPSDPREVLAEHIATWDDDYRHDNHCSPNLSNADDVADLAAHLARHLSVDGGPPADEVECDGEYRPVPRGPWTCSCALGQFGGQPSCARCKDVAPWFRTPPTRCPGCDGAPHARPVSPVGEAETRLAWPLDKDGPSDCNGFGSASSDGPAAPTAERRPLSEFGRSGYLTVNKRPVAAPATCDGSGWLERLPYVGDLAPLARPKCPGCPRCTPCGRCGTVGGGGRLPVEKPCATGGTVLVLGPCPDCGGTAPTEGGGT